MPRLLNGLPTVDYESLTVSSSAVSLTQSKYDRVPPVVGAIVTVDTAPIRWRKDGTAPTATEGQFMIPTGDPLILLGPDLPNFKAIRFGSSNATIRVHYLGAG